MRNTETRAHTAALDESLTLALTQTDKRDVATCRDFARALGYDRLTIHSAIGADGTEADEIVCAHRTGEMWSTWVFARSGACIVAWSALTGADMGGFTDMSDAVRSVLLGQIEGEIPPGAH